MSTFLVVQETAFDYKKAKKDVKDGANKAATAAKDTAGKAAAKAKEAGEEMSSQDHCRVYTAVLRVNARATAAGAKDTVYRLDRHRIEHIWLSSLVGCYSSIWWHALAAQWRSAAIQHNFTAFN